MNILRQKAMAQMMKEMGGLAGVKKNVPQEMQAMQEMEGPEHEQMEGEAEQKSEFMQMMVSPEEKKMILSMRAKSGAEIPGDEMETEY